MEDTKKDMVNTTDCFEAVSAFKSVKNFLFFVILSSLLVLQGAFWVKEAGFMKDVCGVVPITAADDAALVETDKNTVEKTEEATPEEVTKKQAADLEEKAKIATETIVEDDVADEAPAAKKDLAEAKETESSEVIYSEVNIKESKLAAKIKPCKECVIWMVKTANFLLISAGMLYCLLLLMCIKISLVGKLGGIRHISKAFLFALFAIIFTLPWQLAFKEVIYGSVYTPTELFADGGIVADAAFMSIVGYYLRFVVLWLFVTVLFIIAQSRSVAWAKSTLKRLGMLH
jgi:hypothetical protein